MLQDGIGVRVDLEKVKESQKHPKFGPHNQWLREELTTNTVVAYGTVVSVLLGSDEEAWLVEIDGGHGIMAFYTDELEVIE